MIPLNKLHDATLTEIHFNWKNGELRISLEPCEVYLKDPKISIIASEVIYFICPHMYPWGPSVSVNGATTEIVQDYTKLLVEMQSGDVIEITCKEFRIE